MNEKNTSWRARTFRRFYFLFSSTLIYKKKKKNRLLALSGLSSPYLDISGPIRGVKIRCNNLEDRNTIDDTT